MTASFLEVMLSEKLYNSSWIWISNNESIFSINMSSEIIQTCLYWICFFVWNSNWTQHPVLLFAKSGNPIPETFLSHHVGLMRVTATYWKGNGKNRPWSYFLAERFRWFGLEILLSGLASAFPALLNTEHFKLTIGSNPPAGHWNGTCCSGLGYLLWLKVSLDPTACWTSFLP